MTIINSKDIILIITGLIFSLVLTIFPFITKINFESIYTIYSILIIIVVFLLGIIWATFKRTEELYKITETQQREQNKLNEKLKIYEQLIEIKADIKNLKEKDKR